MSGALGYTFGYLLTDEVRDALYCFTLNETLLVWFLLESHRSAGRRK